MSLHDLDAYVILSEDNHSSEYVSPCDERRAYLTGFTGSAGVAVVTGQGISTTSFLYTDSRYYLQAEGQLSGGGGGETKEDGGGGGGGGGGGAQQPPLWTLKKQESHLPTIEEDLFNLLKGGKRIGVDPAIFPHSRYKSWTEGWSKSSDLLIRSSSSSSSGGAAASDIVKTTRPFLPPVLVPLSLNLVDEIWPDRPPVPCRPISVHPLLYAGESASSKLARVRHSLANESKTDAIVVQALDQICWLLNLRGEDIVCNPVFFAYCLVTRTECHLFVHRGAAGATAATATDALAAVAKDVPSAVPSASSAAASSAAIVSVGPQVSAALSEANVTLHPYSSFTPSVLKGLLPSGSFVLVERGTCSMSIASSIESADRCTLVETEYASPVNSLKSVKNEDEINGIRNAAERDSAAVVQFLAWLDEEIRARGDGAAEDATTQPPKPQLTESYLSSVLLSYRESKKDFVGVSFDTISSVGPNSAIIHYKPESGSSSERTLTLNDVYLLDSGGQYLDGTTDVTRTVCFGISPPELQAKRYYTRVLQGHVALCASTFPSGIAGLVLDGLARAPLWKDGLDYGHGTGHGIGAYLNVHEGPFGISGSSREGDVIRRNPRAVQTLLEPIVENMYMSNEPGYYLDGTFGFRIESDVVTKRSGKTAAAKDPGQRVYLDFECVTKVPMSRSLTDVALLSGDEKAWLNAYHGECVRALVPLLREIGDERAVEWLRKECEEV